MKNESETSNEEKVQAILDELRRTPKTLKSPLIWNVSQNYNTTVEKRT